MIIKMLKWSAQSLLLKHKNIAAIFRDRTWVGETLVAFWTVPSVTRFGDFCHFCSILKVFGQFLHVLFSIWLNIEPCLAIFFVIGQIYIIRKGQVLKIISVSGHTERALHW